MDYKEMPDARRRRYTRKVTVALTDESFRKVEDLRASGKDVATFLRSVIDRALAQMKKPG